MRKNIRERYLVSSVCVVAIVFISGCMAHTQHQYPTAGRSHLGTRIPHEGQNCRDRADCEQGIDHYDAGGQAA